MSPGTPSYIVFPRHPLKSHKVDPDFEVEAQAAGEAGFAYTTYSHEEVMAVDLAKTTSWKSKRLEPTVNRYILRGWMMPGEYYRALYDGLRICGNELVTLPEAYERGHYLPLAYPYIETETARSVWMEGDDVTAAWELYQTMSERAAVIKDWVKSAKHRWREACYLPAHTDEARFREIYANFRRERGEQFNRGVVFREFVPLSQRGADMRGFPLVEEYRLFYFKGRLLAHPEMDESGSPLGELARWDAIARRMDCPFITIDVARKEDGGWIVIEVGDGGVSGLPLSIDPGDFYRRLFAAMHE